MSTYTQQVLFPKLPHENIFDGSFLPVNLVINDGDQINHLELILYLSTLYTTSWDSQIVMLKPGFKHFSNSDVWTGKKAMQI